MSELTKEEKAWLKKLQKVLNECPSTRLGFFTTGDPYVSVYDNDAWVASGLDNDEIDPAPALEAHSLIFVELKFPAKVAGLCG